MSQLNKYYVNSFICSTAFKIKFVPYICLYFNFAFFSEKKMTAVISRIMLAFRIIQEPKFLIKCEKKRPLTTKYWCELEISKNIGVQKATTSFQPPSFNFAENT